MTNTRQILINTLKISFAAVMAILVAKALRLEFAVSAGIVAILSVQPTKKETLNTALSRFYAFAIALAVSALLFNARAFLQHKSRQKKILKISLQAATPTIHVIFRCGRSKPRFCRKCSSA